MVSVITPNRINVQRHLGVVDEALKKFPKQVHIEVTNAGPRKLDTILQARSPREVDHHA